MTPKSLKERMDDLASIADKALNEIPSLSSERQVRQKAAIYETIRDILFYAFYGIRNDNLLPRPEWLQQNCDFLFNWLNHPHISVEVKFDIFAQLVRSARNGFELANGIRRYSGDIRISDGTLLNHETLASNILICLNDPLIVNSIVTEPRFPWNVTEITRTFGIRDQVIRLAQTQYAQHTLQPAITRAQSLEELLQIIDAYPYPLFGSTMLPLSKEALLIPINAFLKDFTLANDPNSFLKITRNYGLRDKVTALINIQKTLATVQSETKSSLTTAHTHRDTRVLTGNGLNKNPKRIFFSLRSQMKEISVSCEERSSGSEEASPQPKKLRKGP